MSGFYRDVFELLPRFVQRWINPLEFGIEVFVKAEAQAWPGARVLDAGAGEVQLKRLFLDCNYIALDLTVGDQAWDYSGIDVVGDLALIPIRNDSIDLELNLQVLEHVPAPSRVIKELYRVLRPGGRLILTAPQGWHEHQQPNDFFRFTRFSLEMLFREAGFREVKIEPIGGFFHYLGHRLTYIPKVLFLQQSLWKRLILFPLEMVALLLFCFLLPILCSLMDIFDRKKEFTLCYKCRAVK
jgi:SAM-dependent methyltransferase